MRSGIGSWNLQSHGTYSRVLFEVLRTDAAHVRAAIVDSPQFPQTDDLTEAVEGTRDALAALEATCSNDARCRAAYPHLDSTRLAAARRLDAHPVTTTVGGTQGRVRVLVDAGAFARAIRAMLTDNHAEQEPQIPLAATEALRGDVHLVARELAGTIRPDNELCVGYLPKCGAYPFTAGPYLTSMCRDEVPFVDPSQLAAAAGDPGMAEAYGDPPIFDLCRGWNDRFCVAAGLVSRATSKAVCEVLASSLRRYGIPDEILTDNGKVFTGRFGPQPVEVLFDRICRENGIAHRHTAVRSPTTTGKIERFHQSLRREFLAEQTFIPHFRPGISFLVCFVMKAQRIPPQHLFVELAGRHKAVGGKRQGPRPVGPLDDAASQPVQRFHAYARLVPRWDVSVSVDLRLKIDHEFSYERSDLNAQVRISTSHALSRLRNMKLFPVPGPDTTSIRGASCAAMASEFALRNARRASASKPLRKVRSSVVSSSERGRLSL